jgi:hypothetical protein
MGKRNQSNREDHRYSEAGAHNGAETPDGWYVLALTFNGVDRQQTK